MTENWTLEDIRCMLAGRVWCAETSVDKEFDPELPSNGQCVPTALLINHLFGGKIMRCVVGGVSHYYNILPDGSEVDLTRDQFKFWHLATAPTESSREYLLSYPWTLWRSALLWERWEEAVEDCRRFEALLESAKRMAAKRSGTAIPGQPTFAVSANDIACPDCGKPSFAVPRLGFSHTCGEVEGKPDLRATLIAAGKFIAATPTTDDTFMESLRLLAAIQYALDETS